MSFSKKPNGLGVRAVGSWSRAKLPLLWRNFVVDLDSSRSVELWIMGPISRDIDGCPRFPKLNHYAITTRKSPLGHI